MKKKYLWTTLKSRLQLIKTQGDKPYHWVFLPGGPGLGSESLSSLTQLLQLPGTTWHLDLPGDGSNVTPNNTHFFSNWSAALIEAVESLDNVILVAHSTGGMYALSTPQLQKLLTGLVLIDSAPDASWQQIFMRYVQQNPLIEIENLQKIYDKTPSNETLKKLVIASAPYLFTPAGLLKDLSFFETLPINHESCDWSAQHFDSSYRAQWTPENIPTLILAGKDDHLTPIQLFKDSANFQRDNILIREIEKAGHYPWIENPQDIILVFNEYCQKLSESVL